MRLPAWCHHQEPYVRVHALGSLPLGRSWRPSIGRVPLQHRRLPAQAMLRTATRGQPPQSRPGVESRQRTGSGRGRHQGAQEDQPVVSYKNIFRFAFQEVTVEQTTEDVSTLDHFLEANKEENPGLSSVHRLCSESRKLWRNLQNTDAMSMSQCLWSESRCQENLFLVLGVDAAQKIPSGSQGHILQGLSLKEPEELLAVSSFRLHHCKALIQTKPSGTPASRQGSLITYSLFLKTPLHGNGRYITIPQKKKIFAPWNLKMAFFSNNVC
ncbi:PREDICTED: uncharacterized protein C14orf79 homolog isoform X4 [Chinchilla lanigera]|uniref:uncharacterized protein C14orf79 homolog isoform X4 n=1 Tax=Chinchilla lanigera TaxID=34839 RepID=UPI000697E695|nr:PREDICTED: uncharacterized protein C14orf79 homolog isoform X4 [Chinchilla lanigera]